MNERPEDAILARYERALAEHGDTPQGALWPNAADLQRRYDVMLDLLAERPTGPVVLCDLACGTGGLLARLRERGMEHVRYVGVDRSRAALEIARSKFPGVDFVELDVTAPGADLSALDCDYLVANGLFTVRDRATSAQMRAFLEQVLRAAWPRVRRGLAFNVMSTHVDWERDDLFHAPMDDMAALLHELAGRNVRLRADYGLYEFTCYAWREAASAKPAMATTTATVATATTTATGAHVLVMRPKLPPARALLPYLERIDATRLYSNFGPLVLAFEARLAAQLGLEPAALASAATGTAGLIAAILAHAGKASSARPLALLPAFSFVATAVAAERCGYTPHFADVDAESWMLDPRSLLSHPQLDRIGVVMPVAAFGRALPQAPWREFAERTGIPVVIDAAAAFEAVAAAPGECLGPLPVVLSLHATKSLGIGEGGAVACTDTGLATRIGEALNYGFRSSRNAAAAGSNGKLSEYHAAVGLAALDGWPAQAAAFARTLSSYRRQAEAAGLGDRLVTAPEIASCYVLLRCRDADESLRVREGLRRHDVEFRLWYGAGIQDQPHFAACPADPLPVTSHLAPCLLGLPMAVDLGDEAIAQVLRGVRDGLSESPG